jgi:hypothetical protein
MSEVFHLPADLAEIPDRPAVFLVWLDQGSPYLGRTGFLRRRLRRLLGDRDGPSRLFSLRDVARRVEYWLTGSRLEMALVQYDLAVRHFPQDYRKRLKLRFPAYVKLLLANEFPRTQVTTRLGGRSFYYGPFRSRAAAERFEGAFLDLFQLRRCPEDLVPAPDHPGCIYGEMNLCLRPCQQAVTGDEYRSETARVREFLRTDGASLLRSLGAQRDQASAAMDFEEAARIHKRLERVQGALALRDDLAREAGSLHGIAVTGSAQPDAVELRPMFAGVWQAPLVLSTAPAGTSLDRRLREALSALEPASGPREEHLALLARWYYSSWRDGEWISVEDPARPPYRRIVNAIARVAKSDAAQDAR